MLALTHHTIVQAASTSTTDEYAILGDDVIVSSRISRYYNIMTSLGVEISLSKSISSSNFVEFAKKISSSDGDDYSVIGPGLILTVIKNRMLYGLLVVEAYQRAFISKSEAFSKLITLKGLSPDIVDFGIYSLFGPGGLIDRDQEAALDSGVT